MQKDQAEVKYMEGVRYGRMQGLVSGLLVSLTLAGAWFENPWLSIASAVGVTICITTWKA